MLENLEITLTQEEFNELQRKAKERTVKTQSIEYDLETLIRRIDNGYIKLDPAYQRRHRWDDKTSSRLIESLLLNIPIPTIYLSQDVDIDDDDDGRPVFTVIDGQQRLTAIRSFLSNELVLRDLAVLDKLEGFTCEDLPNFLRRRLSDRTISCLRIDSTIDDQVKYDIFERLNSGSVELSPQELRNAIYRGDFNEMIKDLSTDEIFQKITNMSEARAKKMEDVELVLRFFALTRGRYESYRPNMGSFLNSSMEEFSKKRDAELIQMADYFRRRITAINELFGDTPFCKWKKDSEQYASKFNAAVFDALIVAFDNAQRLNKALRYDATDRLRELFNNDEFQEQVSGSINDSAKLYARIHAVEDAIIDGD